MKLFLILLANCLFSKKPKYYRTEPGYYIMKEDPKVYYKIHCDDELLNRMMNFMFEKYVLSLNEHVIFTFHNISDKEHNDLVFVDIFKTILNDYYENKLEEVKYMKDANQTSKEITYFKGEKQTSKENQYFIKALLDKYLEIFIIKYPSDKIKLENYIKNVIYSLEINDENKVLFYKSSDKNKDENLKAIKLKLYQMYLAKIERKDIKYLKEELRSLAKDDFYNKDVEKSKFWIRFRIEKKIIRIENGKLTIDDKPIESFIKTSSLLAKYENNILYIKNIPVKLVRYTLK